MDKRADIVCGLGFGDEGKGIVTARLADEAVRDSSVEQTAIVRFSGGPQNAHNVCWREHTENGCADKHHTFAQIGSSGRHFRTINTFTAPYVPVDPISLFCEADSLLGDTHSDTDIAKICERQYFCGESLLILPMHEKISKLREQKLRHGSTGRGIFEVNKFAEIAPAAALRLRDLSKPGLLAEKSAALIEWANKGMPDENHERIMGEGAFVSLNAEEETADFLDFCGNVMGYSFQIFCRNILSFSEWIHEINTKRRLIFEGGQGVMLDCRFGFFPNVTFSNTTPLNALKILNESGEHSNIRIHGVTRTYTTRC